MRMYELWKLGKHERDASRLEDEGGPVLFARACDAERCFRSEPDNWGAECRILPVTVGTA
jgi:hypothetical protein